MRWESCCGFHTPYRGFARTARKRCRDWGRCIREGEAIAPGVFTSANRDEDKFERAEEFDIDRPVWDHITFGRGTHNCPGARLGRLQIRVPRWKRSSRAQRASRSPARST